VRPVFPGWLVRRRPVSVRVDVFPDRAAALREMARVVAVDGTVSVQVWDRVEAQVGYAPFYEVLSRHLAPEAMDLENSYWALGDLDLIAALLEAAGLQITETRTRTGTVRFDSVDQLVKTEVEGTPLIDRISDDVYRKILVDSREALRPFATEGGKLAGPISGHDHRSLGLTSARDGAVDGEWVPANKQGRKVDGGDRPLLWILGRLRMAQGDVPGGVVKVTELVGSSTESFSDAVRRAVKAASRSIRNIRGVEVISSTADVGPDGELSLYKVNVKVAFLVEGTEDL
jgi:flavin-binding protein dodecin